MSMNKFDNGWMGRSLQGPFTVRSGPPTPPLFTRTTVATIGPYTAGDIPTAAYTAGVYVSAADPGGEIITPTFFVNAVVWDGVTTLVSNDVVTLQENVTDTIPTGPWVYSYGPAIVPAAPSAEGWMFDDGDLVVSMPSGPRWAFEDGDLVTTMPGAT